MALTIGQLVVYASVQARGGVNPRGELTVGDAPWTQLGTRFSRPDAAGTHFGTRFRCGSPSCGCRPRRRKPAPRRPVRPTSWPDRIVAVLARQPRTKATLADRMARSSLWWPQRPNPAFEAAITELLRRGRIGWATLVGRQRTSRLKVR